MQDIQPNGIIYTHVKTVTEKHKQTHDSRIQSTVNPLYTDTRYNDKICYNDNYAGMKPSL